MPSTFRKRWTWLDWSSKKSLAFQLLDACGQLVRDTAVVHIPDPGVVSFAALVDLASTLSIQISNYIRNGEQFFWYFGDEKSLKVSQPKHACGRARKYINK